MNTARVCYNFSFSHSHCQVSRMLYSSVCATVTFYTELLLFSCLPLSHVCRVLLLLATVLLVFIICTIHVTGIEVRGGYWLRTLHQRIYTVCYKSSLLFYSREMNRKKTKCHVPVVLHQTGQKEKERSWNCYWWCNW